MTTPRKKAPPSMTETLRRAIVESGASHRSLFLATGVQRATIQRFVEGRQSIRLDIADKLAAHFGFTLRKD